MFRFRRTKRSSDPLAVVQRFVDAANRHDAQGVADCLHGDFDSVQPIYPSRNFRGSDQVRRNWQAIFKSEPGFRLTLLRSACTDETVWVELHGAGREAEVAGVFIMGVENNLIRWARVYSAVVDQEFQGPTDTGEQAPAVAVDDGVLDAMVAAQLREMVDAGRLQAAAAQREAAAQPSAEADSLGTGEHPVAVVDDGLEAPPGEPELVVAPADPERLFAPPEPEPEPGGEPIVAAEEPEPEPIVAAEEPEPEPLVAAAEPEPEPPVAAAEPEPEPLVAAAEPEPEPPVAEPAPITAEEPEPERGPIVAEEPEPVVAAEPEPGTAPIVAADEAVTEKVGAGPETEPADDHLAVAEEEPRSGTDVSLDELLGESSEPPGDTEPVIELVKPSPAPAVAEALAAENDRRRRDEGGAGERAAVELKPERRFGRPLRRP